MTRLFELLIALLIVFPLIWAIHAIVAPDEIPMTLEEQTCVKYIDAKCAEYETTLRTNPEWTYEVEREKMYLNQKFEGTITYADGTTESFGPSDTVTITSADNEDTDFHSDTNIAK